MTASDLQAMGNEMTGGMNDPVPWQRAPSVFASDLWAKLVELCGSAEEAAGMVSTGYVWPMAAHRHGIDLDDPACMEAPAYSAKERADSIGAWIHRRFQQCLEKGQIIAHGRQAPAIDLVRIPSSLWNNMHCNLGSGFAIGQGYNFQDLHFQWGEIPDTAVVSWMLAQSTSLKKALRESARSHFPSLTDAQFNRAYSASFERTRGRPRKTAP